MKSFFSLRPIEFDLGDLLVQVVAVALGVIAGLGVTSWQSHLHDRQLLADSARTIVDEMQHNQTLLAGVRPRHDRLLRDMSALEARAASTKHVSLAEFGQVLSHGAGLMIPQSTAWRIAQSNQGIALLPYADRARLTGIYDLQDFYYTMEQRFTDELTPTSLPPDGNFYLVLVSCESRLGDLTIAESELSRSYDREEAALRSSFRFAN